jgi:3-isopropylmalate/(R)-2-methylmalate dehydratase large subunit
MTVNEPTPEVKNARTIFEKIWDDHIVYKGVVDENGIKQPDLLFVDLHLLHEVTSPQAFDGLRILGRQVRHPELSIMVEDHNTPTCDIYDPIKDPIAKGQIEAARNNAQEFGLRIHSLGDPDNGVIHVTFPDLGLIQPGQIVVCGDSHTATHGAFGSIAFGIGTSEVEHVLATQTIWQKPLKTMKVDFQGEVKAGVTAKDLILALIAKIGTGGGQGYAIEYTGPAIKALTQEGRMTISNMTIEAGARVGIIAPDEVTYQYLKDRPHAPKGQEWENALQYWNSLQSDKDAEYDKEVVIDAASIEPFVTWGTNPSQGVGISHTVPTREEVVRGAQNEGKDVEVEVAAWEKALQYMDIEAGQSLSSIEIDTVFIGSCTNGRIEDLRDAAKIIDKANQKGLKSAVKRMLIVPGSGRVRLQAEAEGLDKIFTEFGGQWRNAGCSMCLGMNADQLAPGERSASTSNRNFEGRQGRRGRTHLVSPSIAAATAVLGRIGTVEQAEERTK